MPSARATVRVAALALLCCMAVRPASGGDVVVNTEGLVLVKIDPSVVMTKQTKIRRGEGLPNIDLDRRKGSVVSTKCVTHQEANFGFYFGDNNKRQGVSELPCNQGKKHGQ